MSDWVQIFTCLLFYAYVEIHQLWRLSLWQLPIVSTAFNCQSAISCFYYNRTRTPAEELFEKDAKKMESQKQLLLQHATKHSTGPMYQWEDGLNPPQPPSQTPRGEQDLFLLMYSDGLFCISFLLCLKAPDTFGNCQRLVYSRLVYPNISNLWKFELNSSSDLQENNERRKKNRGIRFSQCFILSTALRCLLPSKILC